MCVIKVGCVCKKGGVFCGNVGCMFVCCVREKIWVVFDVVGGCDVDLKMLYVVVVIKCMGDN